jgi:PPE-repeat protein
MVVSVRSYLIAGIAGIAVIGADVIAAGPTAPPPPTAVPDSTLAAVLVPSRPDGPANPASSVAAPAASPVAAPSASPVTRAEPLAAAQAGPGLQLSLLTGTPNLGFDNVGNFNTGIANNGDFNTGAKNVGDFNIGVNNNGDFNIGVGNTGDFNVGLANNGVRNFGVGNIGFFNTGNYTIGVANIGLKYAADPPATVQTESPTQATDDVRPDASARRSSVTATDNKGEPSVAAASEKPGKGIPDHRSAGFNG